MFLRQARDVMRHLPSLSLIQRFFHCLDPARRFGYPFAMHHMPSGIEMFGRMIPIYHLATRTEMFCHHALPNPLGTIPKDFGIIAIRAARRWYPKR